MKILLITWNMQGAGSSTNNAPWMIIKQLIVNAKKEFPGVEDVVLLLQECGDASALIWDEAGFINNCVSVQYVQGESDIFHISGALSLPPKVTAKRNAVAILANFSRPHTFSTFLNSAQQNSPASRYILEMSFNNDSGALVRIVTMHAISGGSANTLNDVQQVLNGLGGSDVLGGDLNVNSHNAIDLYSHTVKAPGTRTQRSGGILDYFYVPNNCITTDARVVKLRSNTTSDHYPVAICIDV